MTKAPFPSTLYRKQFPGIKSANEYIVLRDIGNTSVHAPPPETVKQSWRDGHHFGVLCCMISAIVVLLINVAACVLAMSKHEVAGNLAIWHNGDCNKVKRLDLWLHLLINVLSTILLGASNYSMQCVSAPTRTDIDKAHRENLWMDIGVPSVRNLRYISWPRRILWCCLVLSSVPLHLMYNSVIYSTTSLSVPALFVVTDDFLTGASYDLPESNYHFANMATRLDRLRNSTSSIKLDIPQCQKAYGSTELISSWSDALAVVPTASTNNSLLDFFEGRGGKYQLVCTDASGSTCRGSSMKFDAYPLLGGGDEQEWSVSYCLGTKAHQHCKVGFTVGLLIGVIACNLVKVICMSYIVFRRDPRPLVTLGDALASFLESPDPTTTGRCLISKSEVQKASNRRFIPQYYCLQRHRRFASASRLRWLTVSSLCIVTLVTGAILLQRGAKTIAENDDGSLFAAGFGGVDTSAILGWRNHNVVNNVLVANVPQLVLSFLYVAYNGLWTCMLLVHEWIGYSTERKPLRVTSPTGLQRSTYRLQLPYRYGIPLMIASGALHWLVSQSIFLIVLEAYTYDDLPDTEHNVVACGYSPLAILVAIIFGSLVLLAGVAYGYRMYPKVGIPLAGSCSAAISAACHPPPNDDRPSIKAVMWGAVKEESSNTAEEERSLITSTSSPDEALVVSNNTISDQTMLGHCTFTSLPVEEPIRGELYAGLRQRR